jgi:hypothetical protein
VYTFPIFGGVLRIEPPDLGQLPAAVLHTTDGQAGNAGKRLVGQS